MIGAKIQQALIAAGKPDWVMTGKQLNPYQKKLLADNGLSTQKYTALLYANKDQQFSYIVKLCKVLDLNISDLV
ncbi:MAG: hypothetical protein V9E90_01335 [Saprospiraceae bacterium]